MDKHPRACRTQVLACESLPATVTTLWRDCGGTPARSWLGATACETRFDCVPVLPFASTVGEETALYRPDHANEREHRVAAGDLLADALDVREEERAAGVMLRWRTCPQSEAGGGLSAIALTRSPSSSI